MARFMRTDLGKAHSRLSPPTVLLEEPLARPIQVFFAVSVHSPRYAGFIYWKAKSRLYPPVVVDEPFVPAPDEVLEENMAPVIYGYGAM